MLAFYIVTSIFIAWIWVDYFRLIDLYDKENLKHFIIAFALGACSVYLVLAVQYLILKPLSWDLNGHFINDFVFCIFGIGLVEESAKIIAFLIFYRFFKSAINEPLDYLVYLCISALGFSAFENVTYFMVHGASIVSGRSILASVTHMFSTGIFAYGIIRYKYFYKQKKIPLLLGFLLLAAFSHGFYDFWLIYETGIPGSWIVTIVYFMLTVSFFSVILNNAINHSEFFSYHKIIDPGKIVNRLMFYYFIVFVLQFTMLSMEHSIGYAIAFAFSSVYLTGFIICVTVIRLSRFKLIQHRWHKLRFELPFTVSPKSNLPGENGYGFRIRGDDYNEIFLNMYYKDYFMLSPVNERNTFLEHKRLAFIEEKLFLKDDETYYLVTVYLDDENGKSIPLLIKPKSIGTSFIKGKYPIVALFDINGQDLSNTTLSSPDFVFHEWAFVRPRQYFK